MNAKGLDSPNGAALFEACNKLRGSVESAEYKHVVLGLIVGGESGPDARPLDLEWALELAAACDRTSTAFFMKQLGTVLGRERGSRDRKGGGSRAFPSKLRRREMPLAVQQRSSPLAFALQQ